MNRVGVFVCHCGLNIERTVDTDRVANRLLIVPGVVHTDHYDYLCSDPGQSLIRRAIQEHRLDRVVVAACSPNMHEPTFRRVMTEAGRNPYGCEVANIREQCSWVHTDREQATEKAILLSLAMVRKVQGNLPLEPLRVGHADRCLVIGGGIAGIQAALDVAEAGFDVTLVEREPTIGGHMAQLSETFPTLDCSQCILTPKMVEVSRHPRITLMTYSEVEEVSGYVGNFKARIRKKPTYVDPEKCNLCGECVEVCPQVVPSDFDRRLSSRKAIYLPFQQAIPSSYTLDEGSCLGVNPLRCDECARVCEPQAIDYDMQTQYLEEEYGAIILATGFDLYSRSNLPEYWGNRHPDILDGLQFERLLSASGPTGGRVRCPSDGRIPKRVVFVQCAGSRDPAHHNSHCSKICCMYTAKHSLLYRHAVPEGEAVVFYIDIRAGGKGYEEFIQQAVEEEGILYLRGKVARIYPEGKGLVVCGVDTLSGKQMEVEADMVVLATSIVADPQADQIAHTLKVSRGPEGFMKEAHPKMRPVDTLTAGIFLAGAAQAPKDIPETVAQASGAAVKAVALLGKEYLTHLPEVATIDETMCSGCGICLSQCPFEALSLEGMGRVEVNDLLCEGCGTCVSACPAGAADLINMTDRQIQGMIESLLEVVT